MGFTLEEKSEDINRILNSAKQRTVLAEKLEELYRADFEDYLRVEGVPEPRVEKLDGLSGQPVSNSFFAVYGSSRVPSTSVLIGIVFPFRKLAFTQDMTIGTERGLLYKSLIIALEKRDYKMERTEPLNFQSLVNGLPCLEE